MIPHSPDNQPAWTNEHKILIKEQLAIPGLHMIGYADIRTSHSKLHLHYHHTLEFVVFLDGSHQYYVENQTYTMYGGDIFTAFPEEPHGTENSLQKISKYIWFQLDLSPELADRFLGLQPPYSQYVYQQIQNYRHRVKHVQKKDLKNLHEMFHLLASSDPQKHLLGYSHFLHFVLNNLCCTDPSAKQDTCSSDILESTSYIHANLHEDLSIAVVAKHCGLSSERFKSKFKEQMGMTPHAYILALKIDTAKILLKDPENTITEIAFSLNFSSSNHFASVFKKQTGFTPSQYRTLHNSAPI